MCVGTSIKEYVVEQVTQGRLARVGKIVALK